MRIVPWTDEDVETIVRLINELNEEVGDLRLRVEEFQDQIDHPDWKPRERLRLAFEGSTLVGYADAWIGQFESGTRVTLNVGVKPGFRRRGIGTALLQSLYSLILEPGRIIDAAVPSGATELRWFLSERGFAPVATTRRLRTPLTISARPRFPQGLRWRAFTADGDREEFRKLHNRTFSGTPRWRPITGEAMAHYVGARFFQPEDIWILEEIAGGQPIGFVWADVDPTEWKAEDERIGYIQSVGIIPEWRGRGLGRLLLETAKDKLLDRGCTVAELTTATSGDELGLYKSFSGRSTHLWMSASAELCAARHAALEPAPARLQFYLKDTYEKFRKHREETGSTLPAPPFLQFCGWMMHAATEEAPTALRATGMTLSDYVALRARLPEINPEALSALTGADRGAEPRLFYQQALMSPRYAANESYGQCFDEPESAIFRANLLDGATPLPVVRVLALGDTDCVGPLLSYLGCKSVHSIDVDPRVPAFSQEAAKACGSHLVVHVLDLNDPLPQYLQGRFDMVMADPPCTPADILTFARAAKAAQRAEPGALLMLALTPAWLGLEGLAEVQRELELLGYVLVQQHTSVLESRIMPSLAVESDRESVLPDLPVVFSDVWLLMRTGR